MMMKRLAEIGVHYAFSSLLQCLIKGDTHFLELHRDTGFILWDCYAREF